MAWRSGNFEALLSTYKYRNEVVLAGYVELETLVQLTGSAYALVYPSFYGFGVPVLEAMQSDVPVVTSADTSMQEIAGEAALYADPADPASLAEQLNRIYIDEALRRRLMVAGREVAACYRGYR
jgi:glycosyltransferase involved in cell wall biosynthesis